MPAASTDSSVYLLRSLDRCEQLLRTEHFSEPLDARQIRRLANIERIVAEACENEYPADTNLEQRISELKRRIDPWVGRKNAVILASKQPPLQASSEAGDSRLLERIVGEQGESEPQTEISSATSASKDALTAERRPQSYASKRSELLGDNEGLRRRGAAPSNAEGADRLLKSQRETHDDLTSELVKMAGVLKANSLAFGDLVESDKGLVQETAELLERSVTGVGKQGVRVGKFRKRSWGTTGMTWLAMLVVVCVFFMLVLFMKVAPKRY